MSVNDTHATGSKTAELPKIYVNDVQIDEQAYSQELQYHQAENFELAVQKAGQALVIRQLLRQELPEQEQTEDKEEEAIAQLVEDKINLSELTQEHCELYYEQNKEKFCTAPLMEVSHILLAVAPDDINGRIKKKDTAEQLIEKLKQDLDLFGSMVTEYSECPSNKTGGSLGQLSKGQTVIEFERQLFPLEEGLHLVPIESRYGYHIVFVNKKIDGKQLEFPMVEEKIQKYLQHRRYRQAVSDYLYTLVDAAEIKGIELELDQENIFFG